MRQYLAVEPIASTKPFEGVRHLSLEAKRAPGTIRCELPLSEALPSPGDGLMITRSFSTPNIPPYIHLTRTIIALEPGGLSEKSTKNATRTALPLQNVMQNGIATKRVVLLRANTPMSYRKRTLHTVVALVSGRRGPPQELMRTACARGIAPKNPYPNRKNVYNTPWKFRKMSFQDSALFSRWRHNEILFPISQATSSPS